MNVSVLSTISRNAGGLFYSVRWLSKALERLGCQPTVFSPTDRFSAEDLSVWNPLRVELYKGFGPLEFSPKLNVLLNNSNADLLHVHGIWSGAQWAAANLQSRAGTPVVVSPRGMLDPWAVKNSAWKKKADR